MYGHRGAEGDAGDVRLLDPDGAQEGGELIGVALGGERPGGLSLSPEPGRSIAMQLMCSVYAGSWDAKHAWSADV